MTEGDLARLSGARYLSVESYRRDGSAVRTPVWIAAEEDKLFCWTLSDSGKVKRILRERRVRLAICTARGEIRGEWRDCSARILDTRAEVHKQARRMRAKYGLLFLPFAWLPRLRGKAPVVIEFSARDEGA